MHPGSEVVLRAHNALVTALEEAGIRTARYHGEAQRMSCHLFHQDNMPRRKPGKPVPECHPKFGDHDADWGSRIMRCPVRESMPDAVTWTDPDRPDRTERFPADHLDTWWRGRRMVAKVWYPYTLRLGALGEARARASSLGLSLTVETGWGIHFYGWTPAVILALPDARIPRPPRPEDVLRP